MGSVENHNWCLPGDKQALCRPTNHTVEDSRKDTLRTYSRSHRIQAGCNDNRC